MLGRGLWGLLEDVEIFGFELFSGLECFLDNGVELVGGGEDVAVGEVGDVHSALVFDEDEDILDVVDVLVGGEYYLPLDVELEGLEVGERRDIGGEGDRLVRAEAREVVEHEERVRAVVEERLEGSESDEVVVGTLCLLLRSGCGGSLLGGERYFLCGGQGESLSGREVFGNLGDIVLLTLDVVGVGERALAEVEELSDVVEALEGEGDDVFIDAELTVTDEVVESLEVVCEVA